MEERKRNITLLVLIIVCVGGLFVWKYARSEKNESVKTAKITVGTEEKDSDEPVSEEISEKTSEEYPSDITETDYSIYQTYRFTGDENLKWKDRSIGSEKTAEIVMAITEFLNNEDERYGIEKENRKLENDSVIEFLPATELHTSAEGGETWAAYIRCKSGTEPVYEVVIGTASIKLHYLGDTGYHEFHGFFRNYEDVVNEE